MKSEKYDSETSIQLEDFENPKFDHSKLYRGRGDGDSFGYICNSKCYRFFRESFLVSTHPRIHRAGFRSRYGVYMERSRHLASFPWIIHPFSTFRWSWEILVTFALLVTLIRQPILISYMSETLTGQGEKFVKMQIVSF
ncbi:potassium/sodium hyperpolarization-activated cyclic nucleotide-gated channel 1-like [Folsomia candida]|uniref:potassium/sodium hyperpolarization-activated cyclic nucleotide-gated channel 1-like n=1 Tax=Folsomia candida TaxID=158441 RepID=UPI001605460D|nr:potassium/sodium hyperpolarization-activated cyclic nucleotide-gated channel 1-like [Folsomia candida]